ncbi:hypothetical protein [Litoribacter populi]|uniref:hypothetical protein n=1 Tax=Litoribacter populi TaxID=2598460 RepID=UPI00117C34DC|nr:hypothetical protein [Litoribacter populi]
MEKWKVYPNNKNEELILILKELKRLFESIAEITIWKEDLWELLCGICSEEARWISESPGSHLEMISEWEKLLEVAELLQVQTYVGIQHSSCEFNIIKGSTYFDRISQLPKWLSQDEFKYPVMVLHEFFQIQNLQLWKTLIVDWGKLCLSNCSIDTFRSIDEVLNDYRNLIKLLEACHLIYLREG